jgi:hypothetical protein
LIHVNGRIEISSLSKRFTRDVTAVEDPHASATNVPSRLPEPAVVREHGLPKTSAAVPI